MFKKSDRVFHIARIVVYASFAIEVFATVIAFISLATVYKNAIFILYGFLALIGWGIWLLFMELFFSFLRDVKFIRNKLYDEDNSDLLNLGGSQNSISNDQKDEKIIIETKIDNHLEENVIKYVVKEGVGVVAIQSKSISGALQISSQIASQDAVYSVATIGKFAFSRCKNLTSIEIPNSVVNIGNDAFRGCTRLENIIISISIKNIGSDAFANCNNLKIYCEAESQPSGWNTYWNPSNCPVVWGFKRSE